MEKSSANERLECKNKSMRYLRQCPDCKDITAEVRVGQPKRVPSIVLLPSLPKVQCYQCKLKKEANN